MAEPVKIVIWRCMRPGCARAVQGVGHPAALLTLGWAVEALPDPLGRPSTKKLLLCPGHHPAGARAAEAQAVKLASVTGLAASVDEVLGSAGSMMDRIAAWMGG